MTLPAEGSLVPVSLYRAVRVLHQQGGTGADEVIEMGHGMTPRRHDCDDAVSYTHLTLPTIYSV